MEEGDWKEPGPACLQKHCRRLSFHSNPWPEPLILGLNLSVHMAASLLPWVCPGPLSALPGGPSRPSPESRGLLRSPTGAPFCNHTEPSASLNTGLVRPELVWASECK